MTYINNHHTFCYRADLINESNISPRLWIWRKTGRVVPDFAEYCKNKSGLKDILVAIPEFVRIIVSMQYHHQLLMNALIRISWILERMTLRAYRVVRRVGRIPRKAMSFLKGE